MISLRIVKYHIDENDPAGRDLLWEGEIDASTIIDDTLGDRLFEFISLLWDIPEHAPGEENRYEIWVGNYNLYDIVIYATKHYEVQAPFVYRTMIGRSIEEGLGVLSRDRLVYYKWGFSGKYA